MTSPLDILVLLKLFANEGQNKGQMKLAEELAVSPSSVNASIKSLEQAGLYSSRRRRVNGHALQELLVHGARFFLPLEWGTIARGLPTSWAAPPISHQIATQDEFLPVWPDQEGEARGIALSPIYPSAPSAARRDPALYELLAIFDGLRDVSARVRRVAAQELAKKLSA